MSAAVVADVLGDVPYPHYSGGMCRPLDHGGRRCPGCSSYKAAASANANRRHGRTARRLIAEYFLAQGMSETAAAVMKAPPSMLPELMEAAGIDAGEVLGKNPMPSTHANPPSAAELIAIAQAEKLAQQQPTLSPQEIALNAATEAVTDAEGSAEDLRKAVNRAKTKTRKAKKALAEGEGSQADVDAAQAAQDELVDKHKQAVAQIADAQQAVVAARYHHEVSKLHGDELDEYYGSLSEDDIETIADAISNGHLADAHNALSAGGVLAISPTPRDTSVYTPAKLQMETGTGTTEVDGRILDAGTAIYRRGSGDFVILQRKGEAYFPVATAHGKSDALAKAARIPRFEPLEALPAGASDMQKQALATKQDLALDIARSAIDGTSPVGQQKQLVDGLDGAGRRMADAVGGGPVRADIHDGIKRHRKRVREQAAAHAGEAARAAALANGATAAAADAAYTAAHRKALGTPTLKGGIIPHFDHDVPPGSLGATVHKGLAESGIRAFGKETADDYAVIANRKGDLKAWGFAGHGGKLNLSEIGALTNSTKSFLHKELTAKEKSALTTYTGGAYHSINNAITGRDTTPAPHIKSVVDQLDTAFTKFAEKNPTTEPMTLMRGAKVPRSWKGSTEDYIAAAFAPGSKMQIGKVTSCTTKPSTASAFAGHPPYMMVVRTRSGLPIKAISNYSGEDEVVLPPGHDLRCVRVENNGIGGKPTVYLVAEDLVAEAEDSSSPTPLHQAA